MTISNCLDSDEHKFIEGTRFQAPDGKIFRSTAEVTVPGGSGSFFGCTKPGTASVNVIADQNGDSYNEGPANYTLPGLPASQQSGANSISAKGAQMSGGTTKTVTVTTQSDVDTAKTALLEKDKDGAKRDLEGRVPSGYTVLEPSQTSATTSTSPSPAVDAEGSTGTLNLKVTYTVLAVKESEYHDLLKAQELKQIGDNNQIYDDGLSSAQLTSSEKDSSGRQSFHLTTEAYGGVKIDTSTIATQVKGKRYGDAVDVATRQPGVSKAEVKLSPTWATSLPGRSDKIKVVIQIAGNK